MPSKAKPKETASHTPRLLELYRNDVIPAMCKEFGFTNAMQVPRVVKVRVNVGLGEAVNNAGSLQAATNDVAKIVGQKPVHNRAKKSISNFGLREGQPIGVSVTLRGKRQWYFLDRLFNIALTRVRDFRGLPTDSFDGQGNYTVGVSEQVIFPEIDYNEIDKLRGLQATIVTSAKSDVVGRKLLELLGAPLERKN